MLLLTVHSIVTSTLQRWRASKFEDVELGIFLLYSIGEALPVSISACFHIPMVLRYTPSNILAWRMICG